MADSKARVTFYATTWCPDCHRAQQVLDRKGIVYQYIDIDRDPEAATYVKQTNRGYRSVPTIVFPDGSILVEPSNEALAQKLDQIASNRSGRETRNA